MSISMKIFNFVQRFDFLKKIFFKKMYDKISPKINDNIDFMNYGFVAEWDGAENISIAEASENLYRLCLDELSLNRFKSGSKVKVLEVGSGLGGGLRFLSKQFRDCYFYGVDLSEKNIFFSNLKSKSYSNLYFQNGDAENIPYENEFFDIVINVESSHCYSSLDRFFMDVNRVLKNKGVFYYMDFTPAIYSDPCMYLSTLKNKLSNSGFDIYAYRDITEQVLNSLNATHAEKELFLQKKGLKKDRYCDFAAMIGSEAYNYFKKGISIYFLFVLIKSK